MSPATFRRAPRSPVHHIELGEQLLLRVERSFQKKRSSRAIRRPVGIGSDYQYLSNLERSDWGSLSPTMRGTSGQTKTPRTVVGGATIWNHASVDRQRHGIPLAGASVMRTLLNLVFIAATLTGSSFVHADAVQQKTQQIIKRQSRLKSTLLGLERNRRLQKALGLDGKPILLGEKRISASSLSEGELQQLVLSQYGLEVHHINSAGNKTSTDYVTVGLFRHAVRRALFSAGEKLNLAAWAHLDPKDVKAAVEGWGGESAKYPRPRTLFK